MRWGRMALALFVGLGWLAVGPPSPARACSCMVTTAQDLIKGSDAFFVGTLVGRDDPVVEQAQEQPDEPVAINSGRPVVNTFAVERVVKGELGPTVEVESSADSASCGLGNVFGQRLGLALHKDGDRWRSGLCSKVDADEVAFTGSDPGGGNDPGLLLVGGVLAVLVLASAFVGSRRTP